MFDAIRERVTSRIINGKKITLNQLSILLEYSAGITSFVNGMNHRAYPSGGARYPLEVYFLVTETIDTDIAPGLYHYDVENHRATVLWERDFEKAEISKYLGVSWIERGSLIFFITATFERNQLKYGERGYRMVLIEAGHVGQGFYLNSKALGLNCCALAATEDVMVEDEILDIDGVGESLVYTLVVG
jgi:SagB-type dehydrogenase family enzyme